jgi:hypothetical protein
LAGPRRNARPQRVADEGRRAVQHDLEHRLPRKFARNAIAEWVRTGRIEHDTSHVHDLQTGDLPPDAHEIGRRLADELRAERAILGVFDEGCMGMYNAIIDDELVNPIGIYKERLSQSALYAAMREVADTDAQNAYRWLLERGMQFRLGQDEATELTETQVLEQVKMYVAADLLANRFGCDAIGIQYQQGHKDLTPASDLAEGLLNNPDRPPVYDEEGGELFAGLAVPHFNEVDEGCAVDAGRDESRLAHARHGPVDHTPRPPLGRGIRGRVHLGLRDLRRGSGVASRRRLRRRGQRASAAALLPARRGNAEGRRETRRVRLESRVRHGGRLHLDIGRGTAVRLPEEETERRWAATTSQWPIMHARLHGVTRDQMMARHRANHVQVAYADDTAAADQALAVKAAMFDALGVSVHVCGLGSMSRVES